VQLLLKADAKEIKDVQEVNEKRARHASGLLFLPGKDEKLHD
jgi:hypothetical protein